MCASAIIEDQFLPFTVICLASNLLIQHFKVVLGQALACEELCDLVGDVSLQVRLLIDGVLVAELIYQQALKGCLLYTSDAADE